MKNTLLLLLLFMVSAHLHSSERCLQPLVELAAAQPQPVSAFELADLWEVTLANDPTYGSPVSFSTEDLRRLKVMGLDNNRFVVMYSSNTQAALIVGEVSSTNAISFGTAATFSSGTIDIAIATMNANKVALAYRQISGTGFVQIAEITGLTINYGAAVQFADQPLALSITAFDNAIIAAYVNDARGHGTVESFVVTETSITGVNNAIFNYASTALPAITKLGTNDFVVAYIDGDNDQFGTAINGRIDPSTGEILQLGNEAVFEPQGITRPLISAVDDTRFIVAYHLGGAILTDNPLNVVVGQINTTKTQILEIGTPFNIAGPDTENFAITATDDATFVVNYSEPLNPTGDIISRSGDISGTTVTGLSNPITVITDQTITGFNEVINMATVGDNFIMGFENQNNDSGGGPTGDVILGTLDGTVLPIVMSTFGATARGKDVELSWTTATEDDNQGFEVERRHEDGPWETIGFVEGQGTTSAASDYTFLDRDAAPGVNYYRLRQLDFGGGRSYSSVVSVTMAELRAATNELRVYPNPVSDGLLTLDLPITEGETRRLRVFSAGGQLVLERNQASNSFSVGELPRGSYFLEVEAGGVTKQGRFTVN